MSDKAPTGDDLDLAIARALEDPLALPSRAGGAGLGKVKVGGEEGNDEAVNEVAKALEANLTLSSAAPKADKTKPGKPVRDPVKGEEPLVALAELIEKSNNIIVMCGAGISVSAGIPDFRTPGTGLYSQLEKYNLPRPEAIFEIDFFQRNPEPFYKLCSEIWPSSFAPTDAHRFIKLLHDKEKLLRCFTQNIDSLERVAGLPLDKIVAAHGNFDSATCIYTNKKVPIDEVEQCVRGKKPWDELHKKHGVSRVKPDIVFFGEALPARFFTCAKSDFPKCDLLIVMGTSLQVHPFAGLVEYPSRHVPRCLVNRERVGPFSRGNSSRDLFFKGDTDVAANRLVDFLGWRDEFSKM